MAKERFIVLDVEGQQTCRPYNVGYIIADRYGKIYKSVQLRFRSISLKILTIQSALEYVRKCTTKTLRK